MQSSRVFTDKIFKSFKLIVHPSFRSSSKFSRVPVRVYDPQLGEIPARGSLAHIPKKKKDESQALYEQLKTSGEIFKSVMGEVYSTKNKSLIALEGGRLVEEGLKFGLKLRMIFLLKSLKTYPESIRKIVEGTSTSLPGSGQVESFRSVEIHRIKLTALQVWSSLETPPGIIGVFEKPSEKDKLKAQYSKTISSVPLTVILDNVRDPGNAGSILRTSAGIGCKVLLSKGCVDPWDMKTLRGGNGAQFLVPIVTDIDMNTLQCHMDAFNEVAYAPNLADSASVEKNETKQGIGIFLADSGIGEDSYGIPVVPYTSVNYNKYNSVYLILGGETTGISNTTRQVVAELSKIYPDHITTVSRINIPMHLPVDSLNVANAFGIIGYEIARQFRTNNDGSI